MVVFYTCTDVSSLDISYVFIDLKRQYKSSHITKAYPSIPKIAKFCSGNMSNLETSLEK